MRKSRTQADAPLTRRPSVLMVLGPYSPAAHRGIARFAAERGWRLHADMARLPLVPYGWRGDGVISGLGEWDEPVGFVAELARKIPVVDIYAMRPEVKVPRVVGDHELVGRQAAEHLLARGWRRLAWFSREHHRVARQRMAGFQAIATGARVSVTVLVPEYSSQTPAPSWDLLRAALSRDLRALPQPFAVFAFNDYDAAFVEDACIDAGLRVPDDVGILGVDDNDVVVNTQPVPLSSVRLDLERIGYEGAALLQGLMDGERAPAQMRLIAPRGVAIRASTEATPASHPAVRCALVYIKANLATRLNSDQIASVSGMSRRSLEVAFRRDLGCSLHASVMRLRLQAVCQRLSTGFETIAEIAHETGFSHGPHLHAEFKRAFGISPRAWRVTHRDPAARASR